MSRDHRKLKAFQLADELVIEVYRLTQEFPNDERFGMTSQLRRASVSVAANLVEGCARATENDYRHFCTISFGSLREAGYYLDLSVRLGFVTRQDAKRCLDKHDEASRVLAGLIRSFQKKARP